MTEVERNDEIETEPVLQDPLYRDALELSYPLDGDFRRPIELSTGYVLEELELRGVELGIESQIRQASITIEGTSRNRSPRILFQFEVEPHAGERDEMPFEINTYQNGDALIFSKQQLGKVVTHPDRELTLALSENGESKVIFRPEQYTRLPSLQIARDVLNRDREKRANLIAAMLQTANA